MNQTRNNSTALRRRNNNARRRRNRRTRTQIELARPIVKYIGTSSTTSSLGNQPVALESNISPFNSTANGATGDIRVTVSGSIFAPQGLFGAYDYFRISKIVTTFTAATTPPASDYLYEGYYIQDLDSRGLESSDLAQRCKNIMSRPDSKYFQLNTVTPTHSFTWTPNVVSDPIEDPAEPSPYVWPTDRWLNTRLVQRYVFGTVRMFSHVASTATWGNQTISVVPAVDVRHVVHFEFCGQRNIGN